MATRPSIKEILEAARKGGPAKQAEREAPAAGGEAPGAESEASAPVETPMAASPAAPPPAPAKVRTAAALGRPLTLKEKLAAARAGGAAAPAALAVEPAAVPEVEPTVKEPVAHAAPAEEPKAVPAAPPRPLGRPMTLQEKMAAARGATAKPAGAGAGAAVAKPAAAMATTAPAAKAGSARALPPLEKITDPKDLAEAARQAAARKAKDLAAKAAAAAPAPAKAAPKAAPKPQTVPPRPTRELAAAATTAERISRRGLLVGSLFVSWIAVAWTTFTAGITAMTLMTVRFMFPNVLAEPPSTIKIGLPTNYEPEEVNDKFKVESGFWVVRSAKYDGQDIIYALQSVCTHLGCPPNWLQSEQKFKCPCHGSGFYISGINFEGPAPRPLERFKVVLADDGQILVDKSQKFQQELGQWSDPDSFIPA
jgi:cytochrome b6-f complex iron-sulfur subunit